MRLLVVYDGCPLPAMLARHGQAEAEGQGEEAQVKRGLWAKLTKRQRNRLLSKLGVAKKRSKPCR